MKYSSSPKLISTAAIVLLLAGSAIAKDYKMEATPITPGALATVSTDTDKDSKNTRVKVKVEHLAKPTLLTPRANEYVVWIQPQGGSAQPEGVLTVGDNEKADAEMTTTASQFVILVTAEAEPNPQHPSNRVILRTDVQE